MKAVFSMRVPPGPKSEGGPVEYVEISGLTSPAEVLHRKATDEDRAAFSAEYAAFKGAAGVASAAPAEAPAEPEGLDESKGYFKRKK